MTKSLTIPNAAQLAPAQAVHQRIVALARMMDAVFLELGRVLSDFHRMKGWKACGHPTFKSYCNDPDVELAHSTAWRDINIHRLYVEKLEVPDDVLVAIGPSKLYMMKNVINPDNKDEWLANGLTLSKTALAQLIQIACGPPALPGGDRYDPRRWARAWKRAAVKYRRWFKNAADLPRGDFGKFRRIRLSDFSVEELANEIKRREASS